MQKVVIHSPGGYDKLCLEEHPAPEMKKDSVRVKVAFAGINYADITVRWGIYESAKKFIGWPITPGFEFSGVVMESDNDQFKSGDEVFGITLFGGYCSEIIIPAHQLYKKPTSLTFSEAAAFPAVFMTAYHALFQNIVVRAGMKVMIHSAAGGVGSSLVQLCKQAKLEVTGVVGRSDKVAIVKELGADHVIDKQTQELWSQAHKICPEGFDIILDANGVETLGDSYKNLRPTGKLVCYGFHTMLPKQGGRINWLKLAVNFLRTPRFSPLKMTTDNKSVVTFNLSFLFDRMDLLGEAMESMLPMLERQEIKVAKVTEYEAKNVGQAHADLESGKTVGKLVLKF
tara:strand:+ start:84857 stop:85882 length:1026 start_codon:yes stop_codon:yes gene_type:complete